MLRTIGGAIVGIIAWAVVVVLLNFGLRHVIPDYHAAEKTLMAVPPAMTFTLQMMIGRLAISGISSLISGYIAAAVGKSQDAALLAGIVLLLPFGYYHTMMIWHLFPMWYHLTFLISLPVLSVIGGRFART